MTPYALTRLIHVTTAVLAMGLVTAGLLVARIRGVPPAVWRSLARAALIGLVVMLATGLVMDYFTAGALHGARWFRIGIGWALATAASLIYADRVIARTARGVLDPEAARKRLVIASAIAVTCVALAVVVMVRRP